VVGFSPCIFCLALGEADLDLKHHEAVGSHCRSVAGDRAPFAPPPGQGQESVKHFHKGLAFHLIMWSAGNI